MTEYIYLDTETGEDIGAPSDATYSVMKLVRQHRVRFVYRTGAGAVVLRFMPVALKRTIDAAMHSLYPKSAEWASDLQTIAEGLRGLRSEDIPQAERDRIVELSAKLSVPTRLYSLGVIVEPRVQDMEDIDALYSAMTVEERRIMDVLIQELTHVRDLSTVDTSALTIAKEYNVQIVDEDMLAHMTIDQEAFFLGCISKENSMIKAMFGGQKVVQ